MTQLREYEKNHHETVLELSTQLMESYSKGILEEELPDGLRIVSKETTQIYLIWVYTHFTYDIAHIYIIVNFFSQLFADKDTLLSAINAAHDAHMLVIDNKVSEGGIEGENGFKIIDD